MAFDSRIDETSKGSRAKDLPRSTNDTKLERIAQAQNDIITQPVSSNKDYMADDWEDDDSVFQYSDSEDSDDDSTSDTDWSVCSSVASDINDPGRERPASVSRRSRRRGKKGKRKRAIVSVSGRSRRRGKKGKQKRAIVWVGNFTRKCTSQQLLQHFSLYQPNIHNMVGIHQPKNSDWAVYRNSFRLHLDLPEEEDFDSNSDWEYMYYYDVFVHKKHPTLANGKKSKPVIIKVGNLSPKCTSQQLLQHFSRYQHYICNEIKVLSPDYGTDQYSFLHLDSPEKANELIQEMNGKRFQKRKLSVKLSDDTGKISKAETKSGKVVTKHSRKKDSVQTVCSSATVSLKDEPSSPFKPNTMEKKKLGKKQKFTVSVRNLPPGSTAQEILEHFASYRSNIVNKVKIVVPKNSRGAQHPFTFLCFESVHRAKEVVEKMNRTTFKHNQLSLKLQEAPEGTSSNEKKKSASSHSLDSNIFTVKVSNVPAGIDTDDLKGLVANLRCTSCSVKGQLAFLNFSSLEDAKKAVGILNKKKLHLNACLEKGRNESSSQQTKLKTPAQTHPIAMHNPVAKALASFDTPAKFMWLFPSLPFMRTPQGQNPNLMPSHHHISPIVCGPPIHPFSKGILPPVATQLQVPSQPCRPSPVSFHSRRKPLIEQKPCQKSNQKLNPKRRSQKQESFPVLQPSPKPSINKVQRAMRWPKKSKPLLIWFYKIF